MSTLSRDEKVAEARRRLLVERELPRVVAADLGVGRSTVYRWAYPELYSESRPERRAQKRAWEREHDTGQCDCGRRLGIGSRHRGYKVCHACHAEMVAVGTAMRRERIFEMWAQGLKQREIAEALGTTRPTISTDMARMRRDGWDLPYRNNWTPEGLERAQNSRRAA